mmetsp:Transcript_13613/g.31401  ORF Transcript_13613/g.31401 Transcript_13613/m.31401 type:complete len:252 (+) Transcript_13613:2498-3253(+)
MFLNIDRPQADASSASGVQNETCTSEEKLPAQYPVMEAWGSVTLLQRLRPGMAPSVRTARRSEGTPEMLERPPASIRTCRMGALVTWERLLNSASTFIEMRRPKSLATLLFGSATPSLIEVAASKLVVTVPASCVTSMEIITVVVRCPLTLTISPGPKEAMAMASGATLATRARKSTSSFMMISLTISCLGASPNTLIKNAALFRGAHTESLRYDLRGQAGSKVNEHLEAAICSMEPTLLDRVPFPHLGWI